MNFYRFSINTVAAAMAIAGLTGCGDRSVATGRIYPERADDIAWENEFVGFRAYGPATQAKGEKAFGYDIFFKHPNPEPVLERLYEPETNPATWVTVDSLRSIDPALADEYIKTFSYHIDHGLGMDCYAVGPTLGAGVAARMQGDTIAYPWCYEKAEVLENGPERFTVRMDFAPVDGVTEHRLITLRRGEYLNDTKVWYDGLTEPVTMVAGFPLRDGSRPFADLSKGVLAYSDPTQGPDNGRAQLGIILPGADALLNADGHILLSRTLAPADTLSYRWGFSWNRGKIKDFPSWTHYLQKTASRD